MSDNYLYNFDKMNPNFKRKVEEKSKGHEEQEPKKNPKEELEKLTETYLDSKPWENVTLHEFEVKFGTLLYPFVPLRDKPNLEQRIKNKTSEESRLKRTDYDNVFKELIALGFRVDGTPKYLLRMNQVYQKHDRIVENRTRVEIEGFDTIQAFCSDNKLPHFAKFIEKRSLSSVKFDDFNFNVTYSKETPSVNQETKQKFDVDKKKFRYINRVALVHDDYPVKVDLSIVKSSKGYYKRELDDKNTFQTVSMSGVFTEKETYEIEIELDNNKLSSITTKEDLLKDLRTVIKFVLRGLQMTAFPIGFEKKESVRREYNDLFRETNTLKHLLGFIGPQPVTLQLENVLKPSNKNNNSIIAETSIPNIQENYVVTEKADGERNFLFIDGKGDIYLINTRMTIRFTGACITDEHCWNTLLDGEFITEGKHGEHMNLYAAFDLYFCKGKDYRKDPLMAYKDGHESRFTKLKEVITILTSAARLCMNPVKPSPIEFRCKMFYEGYGGKSIFQACDEVFLKVYDYKTDGLIFTPAFLSVGGETPKDNEVKNIEKLTWTRAFKWKPPELNTVDFLVYTLKKNNEDVVQTTNIDGRNVLAESQANKYKFVELMVQQSGVFNACDIVLKDDYTFVEGAIDGRMQNSYPKRFEPTDPVVDPNYGVCEIQLNENGQMTTEDGNEIFDDNMVVEFRYETDRNKWIPIRVRYDKMKGNAYNVAESNWRSIHLPVTKEILATGLGVQEDTSTLQFTEQQYYSANSNEKIALRKYHNYFKDKLIKAVSINKDANNKSKQGTLIDLASGRGGDLYKWVNSNYQFVLGLDVFSKGVEESCKRYVSYRLGQLKMNKKEDEVLRALFLHADSAFNVMNGDAVKSVNAAGKNDDTATEELVIKTVFKEKDTTEKDAIKGGIGHVKTIYGIAEEGFDVTSCQFALHYFFKNMQTLKGFLTNVQQCTKLNGYFIGTTYDGKKIFDLFNGKQQGEFVEYFNQRGTLVCRITKLYNDVIFPDDANSLGKKISVSQESIGEDYEEYLVNFEYLKTIMSQFGFIPVSSEEAKQKHMDLPCIQDKCISIGSLSLLRRQLEQKNNKSKEELELLKNQMSFSEKELSSLSNYFVFKKVRTVNIESLVLQEPNTLPLATKRAFVEDDNQGGVMKATFYEEPYTITKLQLEPIILSKDKEDTDISLGAKKKRNKTTKDVTTSKKKKPNKKVVFEIVNEDEDEDEDLNL